MGKSWDSHWPLGPDLTTPDEIDPHTLAITTEVNGDRRQESNTGELIFSNKEANEEKPAMTTFGDGLIESLQEALAHAKGEGSAIVHNSASPREIREALQLTQAEMAPLLGMSPSGYRKWEQGARRISGPAAALLQVIRKEPEAVKRALLTG